MTESLELFITRRSKKMIFNIYQLEVPSVDPYLMNSHQQVQAFINSNREEYIHTASIKKIPEEDSQRELEVLFTIGNSRDDNRLVIISPTYRSLSPGDIIGIEDNTYWCGTQGWLQISFM